MIKPQLLTFLLLILGIPTLGNDCRVQANNSLLAKRNIWMRFGRYEHGNSNLFIRTTVLEADTVSQKTRKAMELLESAGGEGRYELVEHGLTPYKTLPERRIKKVEGIRILSPPHKSIYGSAFGEIFKELEAHDIPVFIDPYMGKNTGGYIVSDYNTPVKPKAALFMRPRTNNITNRHELRHIRDYLTETPAFTDALPEVPSSFVRLLEKKEAGRILRQQEYDRFYDMVSLTLLLGEARASEEVIKHLFTVKGLREMFNSSNWPREIVSWLNELIHFSIANFNLLKRVQTLGLRSPNIHVIGVKAALPPVLYLGILLLILFA